MTLDELQESRKTLEDVEDQHLDNQKLQQYSNLFFLLQSEPRHIATLCHLVTLTEIDNLLQTVMFSLYGNRYENREEHLLLTMFQSALSTQIETATDVGSIARTNTPVSRMMITYPRRGPGQSYLKNVLAERITTLIGHQDLNLEINPMKVYEQIANQIEEDTGPLPPDFPRGVTPEVAAENSDVQAIIAPRLTMLMEITNSFLVAITESVESVPYGIRWICKQIRSLSRRKYPEATDHEIRSIIAYFILGRFLVPAIVVPQAYQLIKTVPSKNPRLTLTLLAHTLQALATGFSSRQSYMVALNPFIENNKSRMEEFLSKLCEVDDFEAIDQHDTLATSEKDPVIRITLNELYNIHTLILQHIESLAPNDTDHLRILAEELGPAPSQVLRKDDKTIELRLYSRWGMVNKQHS